MNPDESRRSSRHLLLLDDDPEAHVLTAAILSRLGGTPWTMDSAHTCAEALERATHGRYELFLVDYYLAGETGLDFLRDARAAGVEAPMIMLTAHGDRELDLRAMEAGASDYLVKGELDPLTLDRSIRYALERKRTYDRLRRQEEELQRARKMEALARFAGGIAHDFNNLLTAMDGYTRMAMQGVPEDDPVLDDLGEVRTAVARAADLTDRLLTLSRKQMMQPRAFDLVELARSVERRVAEHPGEVELELAVPGRPVDVEADPEHAAEALASLVTNALEEVGGSGRLCIEVDHLPAGTEPEGLRAGRYAAVTVRDSGRGMSSDTLARAFEPFFSAKDQALHPGLGLSTAYAIARQSQGTVVLDSEPGAGTTAGLVLPVASRPPAPVPRPPAAPPPAGARTVLVAEDQDAVRRLVRRVLERAGFHVLAASDGDDALQQADSFPDAIHLLLTDVLMPTMSGRELAERLRARRPETRVLYMSGYNEEQAGMHGPDASELPFLQKPFAPELLEMRVRSLIEGGGGSS